MANEGTMGSGKAKASAVPAYHRFPLIDSLRALGALGVMTSHIASTRPPADGNAVMPYLHRLDLAVAIFFVISGFVLHRMFVAGREAGRPVSGRNFLIRRAFRILPAWWLLLALVALFGNHGAVVRHDPLAFYGFAQIYSDHTVLEGLGQAWTLDIEVTFYLLLPLIALLLARMGSQARRVELAFLAVVFAGSVVYGVTQLGELGPMRMENAILPRFAGQFAAGMALAVLSVRAERGLSIPRPIGALIRHPSLTWLIVPVGYWYTTKHVRDFAPRDAIDALLAVALVWPAVFHIPGRESIVQRFLALRPLLFLGVISYGIYLAHFPILTRLDPVAAHVHGPSGAVLLALGTATLSIAAGAASWYLIEQPVQRLSHRLTGRGDERPRARRPRMWRPPLRPALLSRRTGA